MVVSGAASGALWVLGSSKRKMLSMQLPKNLCLADAWKLLAEAFRGVAYGY